MNKIISITIGNLKFDIEEVAYSKLDHYLNSIRKIFTEYPDQKELIQDIEARIAEKFSQNPQELITEKDVNELISTLGKPEDFKEFKDNNDSTTASHSQPTEEIKKLYRNSDDTILFGVCSGIGAYFNIDPIIIRIAAVIFVVTGFLAPAVIITYIILALAVPETKSISDKIAMKGQPLTLKQIENQVKETVKKGKDSLKKNRSQIEKIFLAPFQFLKKILIAILDLLKNLGPAMIKIFGSLITLAFSFLLIIGTFGFTTLLLKIQNNYLPHRLIEIQGDIHYYQAIISGYLSIAIPLIAIIMLGLSLINRKNIFTLNKSLVMFGIWLISSFIFGITLMIDGGTIIQAL